MENGRVAASQKVLARTVLLALAMGAAAQEPDTAPLSALREGHLVVWVIQPLHKQKGVLISGLRGPVAVLPREQTAGEFGTLASNYGTTAGSYGLPSTTPTISVRPSAEQTDSSEADTPADGTSYREQPAGSFGQTAGSFGTSAGDAGLTSGSFGTSAGSYGVSASEHGQTAGSFGTTLAALGPGDAATPKAVKGTLRTELEARLLAGFGELHVAYEEVDPDELKGRLADAEDTSEYPDVLIGALPTNWHPEQAGRFLVAMVRPALEYEDGLTQVVVSNAGVFSPPVWVLQRAPHPEAARAVALWLSEGAQVCAGCVLRDADRIPAASVAANAVRRLLHGERVAELADPAMADFPALLGRQMLATTDSRQAEDGDGVRVQVVGVSSRGRLAAVSVRVMAQTDDVFGVAHPLVVLRRGADGRWRVLHVSLNLPVFEQENERETLMTGSPVPSAEKGGVRGVSLAAPADGDVRPPQPELWWDNGGGAGLQVVEWQGGYGKGWSDARLYLVPDHGARLQTRVMARFADRAGRYKWRVWSVGADGDMRLSAWRTVTVVR